MKKYFCFVLFTLLSNILFSQVPDAFNYRGVAIGKDSVVLKLIDIRVDVKIIDDIDNAESLYEESHYLVTNQKGGYYLKIGRGQPKKKFKNLSDVLWKEGGEKYITVKVYDENNVLISDGTSQLLSVPYALVAKEVLNKNTITDKCFDNLDMLRNYLPNPTNPNILPTHGEMKCIKGHTNFKDGGEGTFIYDSNYVYTENNGDDNGIIILPGNNESSNPGRWLRSFDTYINVNFYGVPYNPPSINNSKYIQNAVDYAASNKKDDTTLNTTGNIIYFPNGTYYLSEAIIVKDGVSLLGVGEETKLVANSNFNIDYLIKLDKGKVTTRIQNFFLLCGGKDSSANCGGMFFDAIPNNGSVIAGLNRSIIKNIRIHYFKRNALFLRAINQSTLPTGQLAIDNQFNVFENIYIQDRREFSPDDDFNSLRITGSFTQNTFIECVFEGNRDFIKDPNHQIPLIGGSNVFFNSSISNNSVVSKAAGISFVNCGFAAADYGVSLRDSENITFDTCWFENLNTSIDVYNGKSINIVNSRFANACGHGSQEPQPNNIRAGIYGKKSNINIYNNYVTTTDVPPTEHYFVWALNNNNSTLNQNNIYMANNEFRIKELSKTKNIIPSIAINFGSIVIEGRNRVFVNAGNLKNIDSYVNAGEIIYLNAKGGNLVINNTGNIRFPNGTSSSSITIKSGNWATFLVDEYPTGVTSTRIYYLVNY